MQQFSTFSVVPCETRVRYSVRSSRDVMGKGALVRLLVWSINFSAKKRDKVHMGRGGGGAGVASRVSV